MRRIRKDLARGRGRYIDVIKRDDESYDLYLNREFVTGELDERTLRERVRIALGIVRAKTIWL